MTVIGDPTEFVLTVFNRSGTSTSAQDLSTATTLEMIFTRPNLTSFTRSANLATNGADGKMRYVASPTDLDASGNWKVRGRIAFSGGDPFRSSPFTFLVDP